MEEARRMLLLLSTMPRIRKGHKPALRPTMLIAFIVIVLPLLYLFLAASASSSWSLLSSLLGLVQQQQHQEQEQELDLPGSCDIFRGSWIYDDSYPLYPSCPILEQSFRCQENGRPDHTYTKWRWKPSDCDIPSFNGLLMLKRLRGMRVAFVGDSMGRTQWESLVCMLHAAVPDKSSVQQIHNSSSNIKRAPYLAFYFSSYQLTVEYHRSPFLVQQAPPPPRAAKRVRSILKLDKLDASHLEWQHADVLVFNSGHWWNPSKTYQLGCYFYLAESMKMGMKIEAAYQIALTTWASWVDNLVDTTSTRVIVRSFEPSHWDWSKRRCTTQRQPNATRPASSTPQQLPFNRILDRVLRGMNKTVQVLNITALSASRSDAHIGKWSKGHPPLDCSHWCLPGVPDTWNQLLYVTLFRKIAVST